MQFDRWCPCLSFYVLGLAKVVWSCYHHISCKIHTISQPPICREIVLHKPNRKQKKKMVSHIWQTQNYSAVKNNYDRIRNNDTESTRHNKIRQWWSLYGFSCFDMMKNHNIYSLLKLRCINISQIIMLMHLWKVGGQKDFLIFWFKISLLFSPRLHLYDYKYCKITLYNLKYFYILIYYANVTLCIKNHS